MSSAAAQKVRLSGAPNPFADTSGQVLSKIWPPFRIALAQAVWGEAHIGPDTSEILFDCLPILGLDPRMTVVEIGAGLGVLSRRMHLSGGVYCLGYEPDPALIAAAIHRAALDGFRRKTRFSEIDLHDPEFDELRPGSVDCWVVHNTMPLLHDPLPLIEQIVSYSSFGAQLLIADVFVTEIGDRAKSMRKWRAANTEVKGTVEWETVRDALVAGGFEIHVQADASDEIRDAISSAWNDYLSQVSTGEISVKSLPPALAEAQRWMALRQALKTGGLEFRRVTATKRG